MMYSFLETCFTVKGEKHLKLIFSTRNLDFLWTPNTILSITTDFEQEFEKHPEIKFSKFSPTFPIHLRCLLPVGS